MILFKCPRCETDMEAPFSMQTEPLDCPKCDQTVIVPKNKNKITISLYLFYLGPVGCILLIIALALESKLLLSVSLLTIFFASIIQFVLVYNIWDRIQIGHVRTTPDKAWKHLLIPFYSLYWIFQAYWGWTVDYNNLISEKKFNGPFVNPAWGMIVCCNQIVLGIIYIVGQLVIQEAADFTSAKPLPLAFAAILILFCCLQFVFQAIFFTLACDGANYLVDKVNSAKVPYL